MERESNAYSLCIHEPKLSDVSISIKVVPHSSARALRTRSTQGAEALARPAACRERALPLRMVDRRRTLGLVRPPQVQIHQHGRVRRARCVAACAAARADWVARGPQEPECGAAADGALESGPLVAHGRRAPAVDHARPVRARGGAARARANGTSVRYACRARNIDHDIW